MGKVIVIGNEKGGVGKTTCSVLSAIEAAVRHGKKTLLVDLDPQNNSSEVLCDVSESEILTSDKLFYPLKNINPATGKYGISVIPASDEIHLFPRLLEDEEIDINITNAEDANKIINSVKERQILNFVENFQTLKNEYDCIIIDTPPSFLGLPLLASLCVVDELYILVTASKFSGSVVDKFLNKINQVKVVNPKLKIDGIIVNAYDKSSTVQTVILEKWKKAQGNLIRLVLPKASWIESCAQDGIYISEKANNRTRRNSANLIKNFFGKVWGNK